MLSDFTLSLPTDLASTFIVVPLLTFGGFWVIRTSTPRRIWAVRRGWADLGLRRDAPTVVIATSSFQESSGYQRPQTGVGQVRAIAAIAPSVARAYGAPMDGGRVRMSHGCDFADAIYREALVCIGGPKTNEVTRRLLETIAPLLPDGVSFTTEATDQGTVDVIRWAGEPQRNNDSVVHGQVIRCANPFDPARTLTVVGGVSTYGTEAAAQALVTCPELRQSQRQALRGDRRGLAALVRAEVTTPDHDVRRLHRAAVVGAPVQIPWAVADANR